MHGLVTIVLVAVNVHMPKDRITQAHQGYGFVEFMGEEDADYAIKVMNMIKLFGKPIRVNKVKQDCVCYRAFGQSVYGNLIFTLPIYFECKGPVDSTGC